MSEEDVSSNVISPDLRTTTRSGVCDPLLAELKSCLIASDCVLKQNRLPSDCLKNHNDELPTECQNLRAALFNCKRAKVRDFSLGSNSTCTFCIKVHCMEACLYSALVLFARGCIAGGDAQVIILL
jgi:cytochrome c oxidase assembly factor 5